MDNANVVTIKTQRKGNPQEFLIKEKPPKIEDIPKQGANWKNKGRGVGRFEMDSIGIM